MGPLSGHRPAVAGPFGPTPIPPTTVTQWLDPDTWDAFVARASDGGLAHRWGWTQVVPAAYRHRVFRLAATRGPHLVGVLPLVLVRSPIFGRLLVSMPYLDTGGLCTDGDTAAETALLDAALELAERHHVRLELRQLQPRAIDLAVSRHKVTMVVDLDDGADAVWGRARSNKRGQVRKAQRAGLTTQVTGSAGTAEFYRVLAANMRDLGSPVHRRGFFEAINAAFGDDAVTILVTDGRRTLGAGLLLLHGDRATLPWSSSLRSARALGPNQLLYWEAVRCAVARKARVLDLGRSTPGSGTYATKREWGASPVPLHWYRTGQVSEQDSPDPIITRLSWASTAWTRVPLPLATFAGALIRGGLPQ